MENVKRNPRDSLPTHEEGKSIVQKYESKDIKPGPRDWKCDPTPVRVLASHEEVTDLHGKVVSRRAIKWVIGNHRSKIVKLHEIIKLTDRRTIYSLVKSGMGEVVTEENTKKLKKS